MKYIFYNYICNKNIIYLHQFSEKYKEKKLFNIWSFVFLKEFRISYNKPTLWIYALKILHAHLSDFQPIPTIAKIKASKL